MRLIFDLTFIDDEKNRFCQIRRSDLLGYTPDIIRNISENSYFDMEMVYLCEEDRELYENALNKIDWPKTYVEVYWYEFIFIENFSEHCRDHKIPFSFESFMSYDWSLYENYFHSFGYQWEYPTGGRPISKDGFVGF